MQVKALDQPCIELGSLAQARLRACLLLVGLAATGILLVIILCVPAISILDQGDYARTVSRILSITPPPPAYHLISENWSILTTALRPNLSSGSTSIMIYLSALVQSVAGGQYSSRLTLGVLIALCVIGFLLLQENTASLRPSSLWVAMALCVLFVASPHVIGYLASFYGEALSIAILPWAVALAPLHPKRRWQVALAFLVITAAATSKPQMFFLPSLVLLWRFLYLHADRNFGVGKSRVTAALVLSQIVAIVPLLANKYSEANYHNAIYTGVLMVVDSTATDVPEGVDLKCIGVDYWGNRITSPRDGTPVFEGICQPSVPPNFGLLSRLHFLNPTAILRLTWQAIPLHSTVSHFHLDVNRPYILMPEDSFPALRLVDVAKDKLLGGFMILLIPAFVFGFSFLFPKRQAMVLSLCAALSVLQVFTVVGGEGVRDLSKHLLIAQAAAYLGFLLTLFFSLGRLVSARIEYIKSIDLPE